MSHLLVGAGAKDTGSPPLRLGQALKRFPPPVLGRPVHPGSDNIIRTKGSGGTAESKSTVRGRFPNSTLLEDSMRVSHVFCFLHVPIGPRIQESCHGFGSMNGRRKQASEYLVSGSQYLLDCKPEVNRCQASMSGDAPGRPSACLLPLRKVNLGFGEALEPMGNPGPPPRRSCLKRSHQETTTQRAMECGCRRISCFGNSARIKITKHANIRRRPDGNQPFRAPPLHPAK